MSTVRDGSPALTTAVPPSSVLSLSFMSTASGKTDRGVSGSAEIGGGGSTAAEGTTLTAAAAARIKSAVPRTSMARLVQLLPLVIDLLLSVGSAAYAVPEASSITRTRLSAF